MSHFNQSIDKAIIAQAQKGHRDAYRHIYDQLSRPVYGLCLRLLKNADDAMDIVQNVMEIVFLRLKDYSGTGQFGFWVRKIAVNQCLNHIRKHRVHLQELEDEMTVVDDIRQDQQHDLEYFLMQLPVLSRTILWLYEVEGLTHAEIAAHYQMSESFSKSQLSRTKKLLNDLMRKSEYVNEQRQCN